MDWKQTLRLFVFGILLLYAGNIFSQDNKIVTQIIGSAYLENKSYDMLERVCDEAGGRLAGTKNNIKALQILKEELESVGYSVEQEEFSMHGWFRGNDEVVMTEPTYRKIRSEALGFVDSTAPINTYIVNAKYGYEHDYDSINAKDKIVLVDENKPQGAEELLRYQAIEIAAKHGALAILFTNEKSGGTIMCGVSNFQGEPSPIPAFTITFEEGKWIQRLLSRNIPVKLSITTNSHCKEVLSKNIIVTLPGKVNKKIVVGAHFDSWDVGQGGVDNGHGTAIVFEIARLLRQFSPENYYGIEFVWFNGEELGLCGSKDYVKKHGQDSIIAMLNLDMTGTPTGFNAMGFDTLIPFLRDFAQRMKGYDLSTEVPSQPWTNSDHIYFLFEGIPCIGVQAHLEKEMYWHYHDLGDTFDKANKRYISDAAAIIGALIYEMANNTDFPYYRMSREEVKEMLIKNKLDTRLKNQKEWIFGD